MVTAAAAAAAPQCNSLASPQGTCFADERPNGCCGESGCEAAQTEVTG